MQGTRPYVFCSICVGRGFFAHLIFLVLFFAVPSVVTADIRDFIPRIYYSHADLEAEALALNARRSVDDRSNSGNSYLTSETLRLQAYGFSYDIRFIQYSIDLGIGLRQSHFSSSGDQVPDSRTSSNEVIKDYSLVMSILPKHPYNLTLFTRHGDVDTTTSDRPSLSSSIDTNGGIFIWKGRSTGTYFRTSGSIIKTTTETDGRSMTLTTYAADGWYRKDYKQGLFVSNEASVQRMESSSENSDSSSNGYRLSNSIGYRGYSLGSAVSYQTGSSDSSSSDSKAWNESLSASLPWNFSAGLSQNIGSESIKFRGSGQTEKRTQDTKEWNFDLNHRLYGSLTSGYNMNYRTSDSKNESDNTINSGTSTSWSNSLTAAYAKNIPFGRLNSGIQIGKSVFESKGNVFVVNENHKLTTVPGSFILDGQDVDIGSIQIWLKASDSGEYLPLVEGLHYIVVPIGNTVQIDISSTVDSLDPFHSGDFDFRVSYSFSIQDFKIETTRFNYNLSVSLFHDLLTPYYSLSILSSKVLSGNLESDHSTTNTVGLIFNKPPYYGSAEYSVNQSNFPYQTWRAELAYSLPRSSVLLLYARVHYSHTSYGDTISGPPNITSQDIAGGNVSLSKRFRNIYVSLGGAYSNSRHSGISSSGSSQGVTLHAEVSWYLGKTVLRLGDSWRHGDSNEGGRKNVNDANLFYLKLRRNLF